MKAGRRGRLCQGPLLSHTTAEGRKAAAWGGFSAPTCTLLSVLQKLPFTIPELVQSSPCRSSDGILYTGMESVEGAQQGAGLLGTDSRAVVA